MNLCASLTYRLVFLSAFFFFGINLFSQTTTADSKRFVVDSVIITGNKKTNDKIILRELNFRAGDLLTKEEFIKKCLRSQQNLMNTSLFVFDTISFRLDTIANRASILIAVRERHYFWPSVILQIQDRNFNAWWYQEHLDFARLNYGLGLTMYNLFGLNHTISMIFRRGYTEQYGAGYRIPYINKKQTLGVVASYYFYRNNQVWYNTQQGELQYFTDKTSYVREEQEGKVGLTHRHKLYLRQSLELFYKTSSISDTINKLNNNYYAKGNGQTAIQYFSLQYRITHDNRDYKPYPLKGSLFEMFITKDGLGVFKNEMPNNLFITGSVKNYFKICNRLYMMNGVKGRYVPVYTPMYYFNRALGFNDLVRGYEYFVIDGQNFLLAKSNLRFQIIKPNVFHVPINALKKFRSFSYALYAGPFVDVGYASDDYFAKYNTMSNQWLAGAGIGIDLVTYYDYVFRTEFTVNKLGQPGIYLHLNAPL
jgi:outer membrane protein assembly factor BamA